jgi:type IX secretion system PorP/SprF family membrane protein
MKSVSVLQYQLIQTKMSAKRIFLSVTVILFFFSSSMAQQTPFNPLNYWVFTPYVYNPGMIGTKDFVSIGMNAAFRGKSNSQLLTGNARFSKTTSGYFNSPDIVEFNNTGIGGSVFHDINGTSRNFGASVAGSYQIPINSTKLSFISFGGALKGVFNSIDTGTAETGKQYRNSAYPNLDLGIYYYGTNFYTGISAVNVLGNPLKSGSQTVKNIPVYRQYFFTAGYKIVLSREQNIVLEPSVLINAHDSTFNNIVENIDPILKLYVDNFCLGTYFFTSHTYSFFMRYNYPGFYLGAFFEFPKKSPLYKNSPLLEFTFGVNLQNNKSKLKKQSHW